MESARDRHHPPRRTDIFTMGTVGMRCASSSARRDAEGRVQCRRREFRLEQPVSNPERYSQSFAAGAKPRGVSD